MRGVALGIVSVVAGTVLISCQAHGSQPTVVRPSGLAEVVQSTERVQHPFISPTLETPGSVRSRVAQGVELRLLHLEDPPQVLSVLSLTPSSRFHAVLVRAGSKPAPFATVSQAVRRVGAVAGINGYFTVPLAPDPMLVRSGHVVAPTCGSLICLNNPRTAYGVTSDGTQLFVVLDGRQADATGLGLRQFAVVMRSLGAVWAVNLDGGASSAMVVDDHLVSTPSGATGERAVRTVIALVRPGFLPNQTLVESLRRLDPRISGLQ